MAGGGEPLHPLSLSFHHARESGMASFVVLRMRHLPKGPGSRRRRRPVTHPPTSPTVPPRRPSGLAHPRRRRPS